MPESTRGRGVASDTDMPAILTAVAGTADAGHDSIGTGDLGQRVVVGAGTGRAGRGGERACERNVELRDDTRRGPRHQAARAGDGRAVPRLLSAPGRAG